MILGWFSTLCLAVAGLGCLYLVTAAVLVGRFARSGTPSPALFPSVTILKPLHGDEPGLFENLASFCAQDYPGPVQIVFGVQDPADPAVAVVERLAAAFPDKALDLVIEARLQGANRKVANLINMAPSIRHEAVVLADSDMRVPPDYLVRVVAALQHPGVGLVTCLYHGVPVSDQLWPRLSALAIDTHFLPNVIVGLSLGLARPCFGSTIALRRTTLDDIDGFAAFADLLADDYAIGAAVRAAGHAVAIPPFTVGHSCPENSAQALWRHEVRWARTIRSVDPAGYAGLAITHAFPLGLLGALAGRPGALIVAAAAVACRIALCMRIERAFGLQRHPRWLVPLRDLLSFAVFVWSFFGLAVSWKGSDYRVKSDGTLLSERRSPVP
jgi:ceramide glucosyltransferase